MHNGIAIPSKRQVGRQALQANGRSMARPTPMSDTITQTSATCWVMVCWKTGAIGSSPGRNQPTAMPTNSTTIGAEMARSRRSLGRKAPSSRPIPATR